MTKDDYTKTQPYSVNGVRIIRLYQRYKLLGSRFVAMKHLYKQLQMIRPDMLFCHGIQSFDVLAACKYKIAHPECCVVADVHSDQYNSGRSIISKVILHKGLWRVIARKAEKHFDRIYYITPNVKAFVKSVYGLTDNKLAPTFLGADMAIINEVNKESVRCTIKAEFGIKNDEIIILTAGKIDENKRTHVLLEALNKLNNPALHLIIIGSIEKTYEVLLSQYKKTNPNIHLTGWVSSNKVLEYFISADLGVFPKSQSVLWQQAICCGLPCIFGYYPGGEYLNPAGNAMFLYSNNSEELAQLIELLISNPKKLAQMKQAAETKGVERFDYKNLAEEMVSFAHTFYEMK
jgi:1,2-diacylglycerol 3-alpha-glucosyltransferase